MNYSGLFNILRFILLQLFKPSMIHLMYGIVIFEIFFNNAAIGRILTSRDPCERISWGYFSRHHAVLSIFRDTPSRPI